MLLHDFIVLIILTAVFRRGNDEGLLRIGTSVSQSAVTAPNSFYTYYSTVMHLFLKIG